MAFEADTAQDVLKKVFNATLSTLQVSLKGGAAIALGAVTIQGGGSGEVIDGTSTYGLEVDVKRTILGANVSSIQNNISSAQDDISVMQNNISQVQDNISVMQVDISQVQVAVSTIQKDISVAQNNISVIQNNISSIQDNTSAIKVNSSQIQQNISTIAAAVQTTGVKVRDTWTAPVNGIRSSISTAAVQLTHNNQNLYRGMLCKAHRNNTTMVYIGATNVTGETTASTCGYPLFQNDTVLLEVDQAQKAYAIANAANQKVHYLGI